MKNFILFKVKLNLIITLMVDSVYLHYNSSGFVYVNLFKAKSSVIRVPNTSEKTNSVSFS